MIDGSIPDGVEQAQPAQQEKLYNAQQVRDVVLRERNAAIEKARKEAQAEYDRQLAELKASQGSMGGMAPSVDEGKLKQEIYNQVMQEMQAKQGELNEARRHAELQQIANDYLSKTQKGKELFKDFEEITSAIDGESFPNIIILASKLDNAAEVVYELGQNPLKLEAIESLALRSPKMAEQQMRRLSESIKLNQAAMQNNKRTNPPMQNVMPSANTLVGSENQRPSVSDFRKMSYFRK